MTFLPIHELIRSYLRHETTTSDLWDWLAEHQWDLAGPAMELAESLEEALVFYDDGHISKQDLCIWLGSLVEKHTTTWTRASWSTPSLSQVSATYATKITIESSSSKRTGTTKVEVAA
jgi:hypothetical protein